MAPFIYAVFGTSKDVTVVHNFKAVAHDRHSSLVYLAISDLDLRTFQGPTALLSLLTSAFIPHRAGTSAASYAVILAFFSGCFQLLMGVLNLGLYFFASIFSSALLLGKLGTFESFCTTGFLMNFVSSPVMSGFMTAASILIILGQVKGLLGMKGLLDISSPARSRNNIFAIIRGYAKNIQETK